MTTEPDKDGIVADEGGGYEVDSGLGYEKVTIVEPLAKTAVNCRNQREPKPITAEEFAKNYPILMAELRAKNFKATEFYLLNDYRVFPSGTLRPEVNRLVENGIVTYRTVQIAEPENLALEIDNFIVAPTTKLLNLLDDLRTIAKEKPGPKTHATQLTRTVEDGTKLVIDTRNLAGAVLSTPERAATSCLYWLDIFKDPENRSGTKMKMRMNLERADALWGRELEQQNPGLYLRVMVALGHPEKAALSPIRVLDDLEAGF